MLKLSTVLTDFKKISSDKTWFKDWNTTPIDQWSLKNLGTDGHEDCLSLCSANKNIVIYWFSIIKCSSVSVPVFQFSFLSEIEYSLENALSYIPLAAFLPVQMWTFWGHHSYRVIRFKMWTWNKGITRRVF